MNMVNTSYLYCLLLVYVLASAKTLTKNRIIGGSGEFIENAPWQVSVQYWYGHVCGGSIFSSQIILTAAHCVAEVDPQDLAIRVGSSYYNFGGFLLEVSLIVIHENYDAFSFDNDIALLVLSESLDLEEYDSIQAIKLAKDLPPEGSEASVTGWGLTEYEIPEFLQSLETPIVGLEQCRKSYSGYSITDNMICTSLVDKGTCQGDSGGPLVFEEKLIGIVSWGVGCADPQYPPVYTSVPALFEWIESNVKGIE
ncbi:hypothetical protein KR009_006914, partial [Drosophila setifemur]